ncbi:hypothetical protein EV356DRAFT_510586 [Viridothelium virens]|uniref:Uncharacterized protein n=1 Tax=Viridothelium virens TaxID=1048519 RepID=A0A6A6HIA1_VIRVR|nr:hypothetical protein EV356DRAFT_510586 [Viridothelium virens]
MKFFVTVLALCLLALSTAAPVSTPNHINMLSSSDECKSCPAHSYFARKFDIYSAAKKVDSPDDVDNNMIGDGYRKE